MEITMLGYTFSVLAIIGALAFMVNIITEMLKGFGWMNQVPTRITALLVSEVVVIAGMLVYLSFANMAFSWIYLVVAFFAAFIVGYLSIFGWDVLHESWERYVPGKKEGGNK